MFALTVIVDGRLHSVDLFHSRRSAESALQNMLVEEENPILNLEDADFLTLAEKYAADWEYQDDNYSIKITNCTAT